MSQRKDRRRSSRTGNTQLRSLESATRLKRRDVKEGVNLIDQKTEVLYTRHRRSNIQVFKTQRHEPTRKKNFQIIWRVCSVDLGVGTMREDGLWTKKG